VGTTHNRWDFAPSEIVDARARSGGAWAQDQTDTPDTMDMDLAEGRLFISNKGRASGAAHAVQGSNGGG